MFSNDLLLILLNTLPVHAACEVCMKLQTCNSDQCVI